MTKSNYNFKCGVFLTCVVVFVEVLFFFEYELRAQGTSIMEKASDLINPLEREV